MSTSPRLPARSRLTVALAVLALTGTAAAAGNPVAGRAKAATCAVCHGQNGLSQMPYAPHLAGQPDIYLAEQLKAYRSGRRVNQVMAVIAKDLSDADIDDLAAWFSSFEIRVQPRD